MSMSERDGMSHVKLPFLAAMLAVLLAVTACTAPPVAPAADETIAPAATETVEQAAPSPVAAETVAVAAASPEATDTTVPVGPAPAEPTPEPAQAAVEEPSQAAGHHAELASKLESAFDAFAQAQQFNGMILVAREGDVVLSKGYGLADRAASTPNDAQTRYRIGSVTKPMTAMMVLMLQERGLLDLDDPICEYVDRCPDAWSNITVEQLLSHTAGVANFTQFPDFEATKNQPTTLTETIDRFRDAPLDFPPGERWNYSDSGYILLGQIIETVTGHPYEEVAQELVFAPLGMSNTGYDHNRDDLAVGYVNASGAEADFVDMSIPHAAGALYSTAEDLLKWDRALAEGSLLAPELQEAMFTMQAAISGQRRALATATAGW